MNKTLFNIVVMLLVCILPVLALDSTTDPTPTIRVEFQPDDNPTSLTAELVYDTGHREPLVALPVSGMPGTYDFPVNFYLLPGDYSIEIDATDPDGNEKEFTQTFSVTSAQKKIWIEQPRVNLIPQKSQDFAIGDSTSFTLQFTTITPASCRIKYQPGPLDANVSKEFNDGRAMYFNNNPNSLSTTQTIQVNQGTGFSSNELRLATPFNYQNLELGQYAVICRQIVGSQTAYFGEYFFIGYDVTAPQLTLNANPETIVDRSLYETEMQLLSDDAVICSFTHPQNPQFLQQDDNGQLPSFTQVTTLRDYTTEINRTFDFAGSFIDQETNFNIEYQCQNPAQLLSTQNKDYTVNIQDDVLITVEETHFQITSPTIELTTNVNSVCDVELDGQVETLSTTPTLQHTYTATNFAQGITTLDVTCRSAAGSVGNEFIDIVIDSVAPQTPQLQAQANTCGLLEARLEIANTSEEVRYNITLLQGAQEFSSERVPVGYTDDTVQYTYTLDPEASGTFTWQVRAEDRAGLESNVQTATFEVNPYDPLTCDLTPPEVVTSVVEEFDQYTVNISCFDEQSDCQSQYVYEVLLDSTQNCPETLSQSTSINQSISVFGGRFCYEISNQAGLSRSGSLPLNEDFLMLIELPRLGIAQTNPFTLSVLTSQAAICRHGPREQGDIATRFQNAAPISTVADTQHLTSVDPSIYTVFEDVQEGSAAWSVLCQVNDQYFEEELTLGYDVTPPVLTVTSQPEPLTDPENLVVALSVSTDDPTVCTYLNENNIPTGFPNYNPGDETSYRTQHSVDINYYAVQPRVENQNIVCRNIAQATSQASHEITLAPANELNIAFTSTNITSSTTHSITWTTSRESTCTYRTNTESSFIAVTTTGGLAHEQVLTSLSQGITQIEVICDLNGDKSYAAQQLLVDSQDPELVVYAQHPQCTNGEFQFSALIDGTGSRIAVRNFTLLGEQGVIMQEGPFTGFTHSFPVPLGGLNPEELTVHIQDLAGNTQEQTVQLSRTAACDTEQPDYSLSIEEVYGGYEIEVVCEDDTGCADQFLYGSCDESNVALVDTDETLRVTNTSDLCFWVIDEAGNPGIKKEYDAVNNAPGATPIEENETSLVVDQTCFNGIEDPEEEGIDCGGLCVASCNSCDNGVKDTFEDGRDCGGVCSEECSGTPEDNFIPRGEDAKETSRETDEDNFEQEGQDDRECVVDSDCEANNYCSMSGTCISRTTEQETTRSGINVLGLVLIVLGLIFITGGVYYIVQSQESKQVQKQQLQQQSQVQQQREQEIARARHEKFEALKKQQAAQQETRKTRIAERNSKRHSLASQFSTGSHFETHETPVVETPKEPTPVKESSSEDFVDISTLSTTKQKSQTLDALSSFIEGGDVQEVQEVKKEPVKEQQTAPEKKTSIDELAQLLEEEKLLSKEELLAAIKDLSVDELFTHTKELLKQKQIDIPTVRNAFEDLVKEGTLTRQQLPDIMRKIQ